MQLQGEKASDFIPCLVLYIVKGKKFYFECCYSTFVKVHRHTPRRMETVIREDTMTESL